jgi:hypothetical protein
MPSTDSAAELGQDVATGRAEVTACYGPRMNSAELGRLEHENMIEALALAGDNAEDALIRHADGVVLIAAGLPIRLFRSSWGAMTRARALLPRPWPRPGLGATDS